MSADILNPCIICLQELQSATSEYESEHENGNETANSDDFGNASIARLVPCGHTLHDTCIKLWIEQATSCPICRTYFNRVEVLPALGCEPESCYDVKRKVQTAPEPSIEDLIDAEEQFGFSDEDADVPCIVCDLGCREDELLLCDSCDAPYHASCLGIDVNLKEAWFCPSCVDNHRVTESDFRRASAVRRSTRTRRPPLQLGSSSSAYPSRRSASRAPRSRATGSRGAGSRRTASMNSSQWNRAWQMVWDRLNRDIESTSISRASSGTGSRSNDASSSESESSQRRREAEEWRMWNVRLNIAEATGGAAFFRSTASIFKPGDDDEAESPEAVESWHLLEQALELQDDATEDVSGSRRRLSRALLDLHPKRSTSDGNDTEDLPSPRKYKRPKAHRRETGSCATPSAAPHMVQSVEPTTEPQQPSLLRSLLNDIRRPTSPAHDASYLFRTHIYTGDLPTPRSMSPNTVASPGTVASPNSMRSPSGSPVISPYAGSIPSPPADTRSPLLVPEMPPTMSPVVSCASLPQLDTSPSKPEADQQNSIVVAVGLQLSLEDKTEIQEVVRDALRPFYRAGRVSKDAYADINKKVSHAIYDMVVTQRKSVPSEVNRTSEDRKAEWVGVAKANVKAEVEKLSNV
ncbi:uncharacterized protein V1518DRAFT_408409 [Limtongia smithiae]|uniref:uncharacterized protein n=1 Tax=Limtongia smithiae TaxID=1125753 RepID=UPI0034CDF716